MLNSSHVQQKLESSAKINYAIKNTKDPKQLVTWLYLMILSRYPTEAEFKAVEKYSQSGVVKPRDAVIDLAWALINSTEFQYRH
jgi:hypothetical protein